MSGGKFWAGNTSAAGITPQKVLEIRERYAKGETQGSLARRFQISVGHIGRIVRKEVWQRIVPAEPEEGDIQAMLQKHIKLQEQVNRGMLSPQEKMEEELRKVKEKGQAAERMFGEIGGAEDRIEALAKRLTEEGKVK